MQRNASLGTGKIFKGYLDFSYPAGRQKNQEKNITGRFEPMGYMSEDAVIHWQGPGGEERGCDVPSHISGFRVGTQPSQPLSRFETHPVLCGSPCCILHLSFVAVGAHMYMLKVNTNDVKLRWIEIRGGNSSAFGEICRFVSKIGHFCHSSRSAIVFPLGSVYYVSSVVMISFHFVMISQACQANMQAVILFYFLGGGG